MLFVIIIKWS